ncbi:Hypothetical protein, putative [Bodo saltans]|uniref:Integrase n=1 Tax=Bodo saltans TaxID=75058 RepID=A0A0S4ITK8_BODSA|nr:Hypothetical protein, putative [Bodo saltans]|eukprot:CUF79472.1 Hypothetical protein, putative [Bodo saltans]
MPKRPRIDARALVEATEDFDVTRDSAHLRHLRVAASTLHQYHANISALRAFLRELNALSLTKDMFIRYAEGLCRTGRAGVSTLRSQLSALRHFQRIDNLWVDESGHRWALDDDLDEITKGVAFNGKAIKSKPTGAITASMLASLVDLCQQDEMPQSMIDAFRLAWHGALRISQVSTLRADALVQDEDRFFLAVQKDKRVRASSAHGESHLKEISHEGAEIFRALAEQREPHDWLFDPKTWNYPKLLGMIKYASSKLCWPQNLEWVFHSTRHGGAAMLHARCETLQMSRGTVQHYTKSNAARN